MLNARIASIVVLQPYSNYCATLIRLCYTPAIPFPLRMPALRLQTRVALIAAVAVSCWPIAHVLADTAPTISSNKWSYDDTITVTGTGLRGGYSGLKRLCLSPNVTPEQNACFGHYDSTTKTWDSDSDPNIKEWTDNTIVFTVPAATPPSGLLNLFRTNDAEHCFGDAGCNQDPTETELQLGNYTAYPTIDSVVDALTQEPVTTLEAGKKYEIHGALFGREKGTISVAAPMESRALSNLITWNQLPATDITSWDVSTIELTPSKSADLSKGIKVRNGVLEVQTPFIPAGATTDVSPSASSQSSQAMVSSIAEESAFSDVPSSYPYFTAIAWAKQVGILSGYPDGTFRPQQVVNRAELLKILLGAAKADLSSSAPATGFSDVDEAAWYAPFLRYAKAQGIVQGYSDGTFKPNQPVNAAEALKMAYVSLGISTKDVAGPWYARYLSHAQANGILHSPDLDVSQGMTRQDVAWIVWKLTLSGEVSPN